MQKFLEHMQMCVVQIVDRIAQTQMGKSRTNAIEYEEYIIPTSKKHKIPLPGNRFPDYAGSSWKAMCLKLTEVYQDKEMRISEKSAGSKKE